VRTDEKLRTATGTGATGRDEAGAVLILALVFLLVASGIIGFLLSATGNDLLNTTNLQASRSQGYSAGGAVDVAIQTARYSSPDSLTTALTAGESNITSLAVTNLTAPIAAGDPVTIGSGSTAQTVLATASAPINATAISVNFTSTWAQPKNTLIYDDVCAGTSPSVSIAGNSIAVWCSLVWTPQSATTRVETFSACPASTSAASCTANPLVQAVVTFDDYPSSPLGLASSSACTSTCGAGMTIDSWVIK
jgi:hypothetical protein